MDGERRMKFTRLAPAVVISMTLASSTAWAGTQAQAPSRAVCSPALISAVERGDVPSIAAELDAGASIRCADDRGNTLLHRLVIAWTEGDDDDELASSPVAKLLIDRGADGSALDATGKTPLMLACAVQSIGAVQGLLAAGADPNAAGPDSSAALEYALQAGDPDIVTALLRGRANPNQRISGKGLPLITALTLGSPALVELLLRAGADPRLTSAMGTSALDHARKSKSASMVALLEKPVPPEQRLKLDPAPAPAPTQSNAQTTPDKSKSKQ